MDIRTKGMCDLLCIDKFNSLSYHFLYHSCIASKACEGSAQAFLSDTFLLANTLLRYHLLTSGSVHIYLSYQHFSQMFTRFLSLNLILLLEELIPAVARVRCCAYTICLNTEDSDLPAYLHRLIKFFIPR